MPVPARHSLGWRKITSSPRNHQEKVAERKGKKKISLPGWTRETAFLPVKIIRVCVRFLWKNKGKKEGGGKKRNENVRRGGERERKPGNIDLIRGKGYRRFPTTLSVADISRIMHQPARNMFYLFPLSFSRRGLFAKLPDHRGIPRVCNCVRGCLSLELFLDWSQQCLLRRERVETTGGGAFEVAKRCSLGRRGWKFVEIFILEIFIYRYSILEFFLSSYMQWLKWLDIVIKYGSMNHSFDIYFWNYIASEICSFASLLRVLNIFLFSSFFLKSPRAASDDYQLPEKE